MRSSRPSGLLPDTEPRRPLTSVCPSDSRPTAHWQPLPCTKPCTEHRDSPRSGAFESWPFWIVAVNRASRTSGTCTLDALVVPRRVRPEPTGCCHIDSLECFRPLHSCCIHRASMLPLVSPEPSGSLPPGEPRRLQAAALSVYASCLVVQGLNLLGAAA